MYTGNDREKWARKNRGWAFTFGLVDEAQKFDWVGDFPEVDTDGHLTGQCVEPTPDGAWTVVDVIQPKDAPPYVQEGSGASMAVVRTADLQARRAIETAAPLLGVMIDSVTVEQGNNSDWLVRVHLRSYDAAKLVAFFERMKGGADQWDSSQQPRNWQRQSSATRSGWRRVLRVLTDLAGRC